LKRKDQLQALVDLIDGHSYLAQRARYALATRSPTLTDLLNPENADAGPFGNLLYHHRRVLEAEPALRHAMMQVLGNGNCASYEILMRLRSIGLVSGYNHNDVRIRRELYRTYFRKVLS
jgi:hypothetical protein